MRIKKPASKKRTVILTISIVLMCIVALFTLSEVLGWTHIFSSATTDVDQSNPESQAADDANKKADYLDSTSSTTTDKTGTTVETTPEVPTSSDTIDMSVSQQGGSVTIITKLDGQGYSSGTCALKVSANGQSTSQSADIIYQAEYSTCAGFTVPVSAIGPGAWTIELSVTPLNGSAIVKTITKEVQ